MVKIHLIRTASSMQSSRALIAAGPPHPERMVKRLPIDMDSSRGMVAYGPAAGTRLMRKRPSSLANVTHWISLPFGWTLTIEGKRRKYQIHAGEE